MNEFLLILHDPTDSPLMNMSPEEMQSVIARYNQWAGKMGSEGKLKAGNKLEDGTARHLTGRNGQLSVTDGPYPETKEVIGGYFMITADTFDEAVDMASTCPHLDFGRIEIRRVEKV